MSNEPSRTSWVGIIGLIGTWGSVATSWKITEEALRVAALIIGVIVGIWSLWRLHRMTKVEIIAAQLKLCRECKDGFMLTKCHIPLKERPRNCPELSKCDDVGI